jgi:hypothetical protein
MVSGASPVSGLEIHGAPVAKAKALLNAMGLECAEAPDLSLAEGYSASAPLGILRQAESAASLHTKERVRGASPRGSTSLMETMM